MINENKFIENAFAYIKEIFTKDYSAHDYYHSVRVYNNALNIAQKEGGNFFIIKLSALLHDVDDRKLNMETTIYFIRHAESEFIPHMDKERRLTEKGKEDSLRIIEILKNERIDLFTSSLYKRAIDTIRELARYYNKEIVLVDDFRERDMGVIPEEGFLSSKKRLYEDFNYIFPKGESSNQAQHRAVCALKDLINKNQGKKIVIGTHGDIMTLMLNYFDKNYGYEFWLNSSMPDIYRLKFKQQLLVKVDKLWHTFAIRKNRRTTMLEKMNDFFEARIEDYDSHMINNVEGCKEGYKKMAELLPKSMESLLDLGCGTGLELEEIFKIHPKIKVTGVDLTKAMLDKLQKKYHDKDITLINASYFDYDFGIEKFDAVISFQTLHHFSHDMKTKLYSKIYSALKPTGKYIECDYMVVDQAEEDFYFSEYERLREEQNLPEGEFYHYDTPCTIENQIRMLKSADFKEVQMVWRKENTTIIVADKEKGIS